LEHVAADGCQAKRPQVVRLDCPYCVCCSCPDQWRWKHCASGMWCVCGCGWRAHDCAHSQRARPLVDGDAASSKGCKQAWAFRLTSRKEEGEYGGYEYASDHQHAESGDEEHQLGSGVLYQPLGGESASGDTTSSTVPLCEAVANGPCARSVPDDHSPNVQSECNRTGQHCSGHRGGGRSRNEGLRKRMRDCRRGYLDSRVPGGCPSYRSQNHEWRRRCCGRRLQSDWIEGRHCAPFAQSSVPAVG
jgi:hypothetical protein